MSTNNRAHFEETNTAILQLEIGLAALVTAERSNRQVSNFAEINALVEAGQSLQQVIEKLRSKVRPANCVADASKEQKANRAAVPRYKL